MMSRAPCLLVLMALSCAPAPEEGACAWPSEAVAPDGTVEDSCGWYTLAVGERLIANVYTNEPEPACAYDLDAGLALRNTPIYSAMSDDAPKYTVDIVAEATGDALLVDVTCDDETRWQARVDVQ